ncbi:MAG: hypothetical protein GF344_17555 [Chitinivibrionales bacterium]|nr:hypothetical protein [Chitinivibrionales bacterium]MBD3358473.1 hypothetical protein [Chitinivibrionales bacterium]
MSDNDGITPHESIKAALESLQRARDALRRDPTAAATVGRLDKAVTFVELIAEDVPSSTEEQEGAAEPKGDAYTPIAIPVEELLEPISDNAPTGENARVTGEFNELLSFVVNRARQADFRPQYREAAKKATKLLRERGKDLGVAVRLIEAGIDSHGFAAVADGLLLINGLLSRFWEGVFPEAEDNDCEARANELSKLEELVIPRLRAKYGEAHEYAPGFRDRQTAEREHSIFAAMISALDELDRFTYEKFDDQAPNLGELRKALEIYQRRVQAEYQVYLDQDNAAKSAAAAEKENMLSAALQEEQARAEEVARQKEYQERLQSMPKIPVEPQSVDDACSRLDTVAWYLVEAAPSDPLGYLVNRARRWFSPAFKGEDGCLSPEKRMEVAQLVSGKKWKDVLRKSESAFVSGGHKWLDLQRFAVEAARRQGLNYAGVADAICDATSSFLKKKENVPDEQLPDLTPAASPETKEWLLGIKSARLEPNQDAPVASGTDSFTQEVNRAREVANKGDLSGAVRILDEQARKAGSGRERFIWRLHIAELCVDYNLARIAIPGIEELVRTVDGEELAEWEDRQLLSRVYRVGHQGYLKLYGPQKAPADKVDFFHDRICLYDPEFFVPKKK